MGITLNLRWAIAANATSPVDVSAWDRSLQFAFGWFAHPLFVNGDYPDVMKTMIAQKSAAMSFNQSRLPEFSPQEIIANRGKQ